MKIDLLRSSGISPQSYLSFSISVYLSVPKLSKVLGTSIALLYSSVDFSDLTANENTISLSFCILGFSFFHETIVSLFFMEVIFSFSISSITFLDLCFLSKNIFLSSYFLSLLMYACYAYVPWCFYLCRFLVKRFACVCACIFDCLCLTCYSMCLSLALPAVFLFISTGIPPTTHWVFLYT